MAERYDVLVIGAGPGGLAAARAAATRGAHVGCIDAQAHPGGQIWRRDVQHKAPSAARDYVAALLNCPRVHWMARTRVVAATANALLVEDAEQAKWLEYSALILATGARELLLPFPGWTLPGVTGAGGLQALAKQGWPLANRRVVVAGSGPLLLATAAAVRRHGADVLGVYEQASSSAVRGFVRGLWRWPEKGMQAAGLRAGLARVPYRWGHVVVAARGDERVREIEVQGPQGSRRLACDYVAVGYGLIPNVRLAQMLGCRLELEGRHAKVVVEADQRSSIANVYAVGEACGIGGRDCALAEGTVAGIVATGSTQGLAVAQRRRKRARDFAKHLRTHFVLDARIHTLARPETVVCRCEDVPLAALNGYPDARSAKLATRCGMGPCQGRICGAALDELGHFPAGIAPQRPPVFPARLATLATASHG